MNEQLLEAIPFYFFDYFSTHLHGRMESLLHSFLASAVDSIIGHSEGLCIVLFWGVTLWFFPRLTEKNKFQRHLPFISIWVFLHHILICLFFDPEFPANP